MQQDSVSGVNDESVDSVLPVEPLSFPLHGSRLIEASAGTGKTFTIAALYLRLVLGHGNDGGAQRGFSRPLDPPEILVVTFTEAATLELRDRIRARLSEAAAHFRLGVEEQLSAGRPLAEDEEWGEQESAPGAAGVPGDRAVPAGKSVDAYLAALRDSYPADTWAACAARLQLAAEWMDEAAVSTIHGWCSRMLREHAFDSGSLFTQNPAENDAELRAEAFRDYWRSFVQQFDRDDARIFAGWWADFDAFRKQIDGNLSRLLAVEGDAITPAQAITQLKTALDALKQPWRDEGWAAALKERLLQACDKKHVNGSKLRKDTVIKRMDALLHWANTDGLLWPVEGRDSERPMDWGKSRADSDPVPWLQKNLSADAFADRTIWKDPQLTDHPAFAEISALPGQLRALERFKAGVLRHAARWVDERHRLAREQRSELGFDDMLHQLDRALQAEGGEVLAHRIRQQFPVALIDEFQDTDPLQYRIFDSVYRVGDAGVGALTTDVLAEPQTVDGGNGQQGAWRSQAAADDGQTALILIGDPKQAIYAFRDADIHTYLRARRATRGRHYTLDRNFRSSTAMVEAVNHLFRTAEEREGSRGAFRFAREGRNPVPFMPVKAAGRRDAWWDRDNGSDGVAPALTLWQPPVDDADASLGKETYEARFSAATANEIARLLRAGQERSAGFGDNRWVRPADIAVLVNNYRQANLVRKALQGHGIPSVYLSDKESVYDSGVADDLLRFLMACADPGDGALVRSALGSRLAGLRPEELIELRQDEMRWEERVADFQRYRQIWRQKGVLPMVRHLLQDFRVTERLLMAGRERELTDVLHLAELLQQASAVLDGEQALIRHFREQRLNPSGDADSRRQRLESDDERVRVVTVHKSKGLEYPLVFIPFFCDVREVDGKALVLSSHDEHGQPRHVLNLEDDSVEEGFSERGDALAAADEERLGEDLRKLYVALTRARHATWIGFDALKTLPASAAGHLLGYQAPGEGADAADSDGMGEGAAQEAGASAHRKGGKKAKESPEEKRARQAAEVRAARQALADCVSRMLAGARAGEMVVRVPPVDAPGEPLHLADEDVHWKDAPALPATRWQPWWIASYSALLLRQARQGGDIHYTESAREDNWLEDVASLRVAESDGADVPVVAKVRRDGAAEDGGPDISMHGFPRGPRPGSFLHGLLEWAGQQGFARLSALPVLLEDEIARRLDHQPDWQPWQAVLGEWLGALLGRPIIRGEGGQKRMALADLSVYQVEMNFMLPVTDVNVPRLDAWACRHSFGGQPRPALSSGTLNGMLKGVIDLVFEHDGRYFVLDYKSNWLGGADADYAQENMQAVMLHHRYDLQLIFYVLALHRLLKSRLPDYDYDRHVGGAIYLFMRGIDADTGGIFPARPDRRMIETLDAMFRGELSLSSPHPEDLGEALA
ncbi:MAG: UvrD-helicase domain-containing protein [Lautropia sp.]|nr:UvrD-helicase domain-containing protein [Lautropia sp.]